MGGRRQRRGKQGQRVLRAGLGGEGGPVRSTEPAGSPLSRARGTVAGLGMRARRPEECGGQLVFIVGLGRGDGFSFGSILRSVVTLNSSPSNTSLLLGGMPS